MGTFSGARIRLARNFHGLSLEDVGASIGTTRQFVHKLEIGASTPRLEIVKTLADVLSVDKQFFDAQDPAQLPPVTEEQFHFRKHFTARNQVKSVALAQGEMASQLVAYLDAELKLPEVRIPTVDPVDLEAVERAAELCRIQWGLGSGPIDSMSRLAENVGAVITSFFRVGHEIDALSVATCRPLIVRNRTKVSACRQRFDIAHELGHFVLHAGKVTGDRTTESQAHRFANALLVPRSMMVKHFPAPARGRFDWLALSRFKMTWKISKGAALYRAKSLGLLTEIQYRSAVITMKKSGEGIEEREDRQIAIEEPELISRSFRALRELKKIRFDDVASALRVRTDFLEAIVGPEPRRESGAPPLRIVRTSSKDDAPN